MTAPLAVPITVELRAEPATVTAATRAQFMVGFTVRNLGTEVLDPQLDLSELRVNGALATAWNMALMNSGHERKWRALPPSDTVSGRWRLAAELFPEPGDYTLVLTVSGVTSAAVDVHVTP